VPSLHCNSLAIALFRSPRATSSAISPYLRGNGDAPDAPPLASIITIASTTATVTFNGMPVTGDTITDAEYVAPAVDTRRPATANPHLAADAHDCLCGYDVPRVMTLKPPHKIV
jgi:hypothetical protein